MSEFLTVGSTGLGGESLFAIRCGRESFSLVPTLKLTLNEWNSPAGDRRRLAHAGCSGGLDTTPADPHDR